METETLASQFPFAQRRLWLALGWALIFGVVWLSLTPAPVQIQIEEGDKLGHLLAYGSLMLWFSNLYGNRIERLFVALGFVAMGIALEFIQGWFGFRTFSVMDMAANASGVFAGWALAPPRTPNFLRWFEGLSFARR